VITDGGKNRANRCGHGEGYPFPTQAGLHHLGSCQRSRVAPISIPAGFPLLAGKQPDISSAKALLLRQRGFYVNFRVQADPRNHHTHSKRILNIGLSRCLGFHRSATFR
jgi:hypothetical protein